MRSFVFIVVAAAAGVPARGWACATCACGDPTLTTLGNELPLAGRLRFAAHASMRSEDAGVPRVDEIRAEEKRLTLSMAWSPVEVLTVGLAVPVVLKSAAEISGRRHVGFGLADVELRARYVALDLRGSGERHLVSVHAGADVPSMPTLRAGTSALPVEAQPGSGALSGLVGASYSLFARPWSFYASATGRMSTLGQLGVRPGEVALVSVGAQLQAHAAWAVGLAFHGRLDAAAEHLGAADPHSGGVFGVLAPTIVFSPTTDWLVTATLDVPIIDALDGEHDEGARAMLGVTCDL